MPNQVTEADYQKFFQLKRLATERFRSFLVDLERILISDGSEQCPKCLSPFEQDQNFCGRCKEDLRAIMLVCPSCLEAHHYPASETFSCCCSCGVSPWAPVKASDFSGEIHFPESF